MKYIEAITPLKGESNTLFLAGGITDCPDWQQEMRGLLQSGIDMNLIVNQTHIELTLLNPRRANFPIDDPDAARVQIMWEHRMLEEADMILFWFPEETLCPIVLYELGAWSITAKTIFVGVHPNYQRRQDVEIQTSLSRPEVKIVYSLPDLADAIIDYNYTLIY